MQLVWTRSTLLGESDDLITWALDEPVSHFAVIVNDVVCHSSWSKGVDVSSIDDFYKNRQPIYEIEIPSTDDEKTLFVDFVSMDIDRGYDFRFFLWLTWRAILYKFFKKQVPQRIESQESSAVLCTEILDYLPHSLDLKYDKMRAVTPYRLFKEINKGVF